jgi:PRC-barrel domain
MTDRLGTPDAFHDRRLVDRAGVKVGRIAEVYVDPRTQRLGWALVHTGLFGTRPTIVPIGKASQWGSDISAPFPKSVIEGAPTLDPGDELSLEAARAMSAHYGVDIQNESEGTEING